MNSAPYLGPAPVVIFGSFAAYDWGLLRQRQQNIVEWLCGSNSRVIYVERMGATPKSPTELVSALSKRWSDSKAREATDSVPYDVPPSMDFHVNPIVPLHGIRPFDTINGRLVIKALQAAVAPFALSECAAFVFYPSPYVLEAVRGAGFKLVVHDAAHRYALVPEVYGKSAGRVDRALAAFADIATCDSNALCDDRRRDGIECLRIPQGLAVDAWHLPEPDDSVVKSLDRLSRSGPIAGFVGAVSDVVDAELVNAFAEGFRGSVVLVGPDLSVPRGRFSERVTSLGSVPAVAVPAVMRRLDVGLVPYICNERTDAVLPTKLVEYLASGCHVLSTPLPEVVAVRTDLPAAVTIASDAAAWRDFGSGWRHESRHPCWLPERVEALYSWETVLAPLGARILAVLEAKVCA